MTDTLEKTFLPPSSGIEMESTTSRLRGLPRVAGQVSVALLLTSSLGCRICATCDENAYASYGGAWQRTLRDDGRVGSLFAPAGARESQLVERESPPRPDELERARAAESEAAEPAPIPFEFEERRSPEEIEAERERRRERLESLELEGI